MNWNEPPQGAEPEAFSFEGRNARIERAIVDGAGASVHIIGIGTDITECPRIGRMIQDHGELFLRRVYTEREIDYCNSRKQATEHFAGRWAAKEAVLKALGTGWIRGISWRDVEIRNNSGGAPLVVLHSGTREIAATRGVRQVLVTISHCRTYATAYAVALSHEDLPPIVPSQFDEDLPF